MPSHSCLLLCAAASAFLRCSTQSSLTPLAAKKRLAELKNPNGAKRKKKAPRGGSKEDADAAARAAAGDAVALTLDVLRAVQQPAFLAHPAFERMKGLPALAEARPSSIAGAGTGLFGRDNHFPTGDSAFLADATDEPFFDGRAPDASAAYKQYVVGGRSLFGAADDVSTPYFIDVNPLRPNPTGWTASLVNDGASAAAGDEASAVSYYEASRARKNCALVPVGPAPLLAYATTRDVSAGDEFLTTYGAEYWVQGVDASPRVVDCARETARDLDDVATLVATSYAKDISELERMFGALARGEVI